jgi:CHAP domain
MCAFDSRTCQPSKQSRPLVARLFSMKLLTDPAVRAALRIEAARVAQGDVGYVEGAGNRTKYGKWFGLDGNPWCAMACSKWYADAATNVGCDNPLAGLQTPKGFAGTQIAFAKAKLKGMVIGKTEPVLVGDLIFWRSTLTTGHVGLVVKVHDDGSFDVTEGNTSRSDHSSRNGGEVAIHRHTRKDGKHKLFLGIVRPTRAVYKPSKTKAEA